MGKIIRNGIEYSGTFDDATSVNYDNSVSGLKANSVQEGIDELADGLKNTSVVDNLLSTSTTLPLSANQGRILNESLTPRYLSYDCSATGVTAAGNYFKIDKFVMLETMLTFSVNLPAGDYGTISLPSKPLRPVNVIGTIVGGSSVSGYADVDEYNTVHIQTPVAIANGTNMRLMIMYCEE